MIAVDLRQCLADGPTVDQLDDVAARLEVLAEERAPRWSVSWGVVPGVAWSAWLVKDPEGNLRGAHAAWTDAIRWAADGLLE